MEPSGRAVLVGRFKVEPLSAARRNDLVGTAARASGSFNSRIPLTEAGRRSVGHRRGSRCGSPERRRTCSRYSSSMDELPDLDNLRLGDLSVSIECEAPVDRADAEDQLVGWRCELRSRDFETEMSAVMATAELWTFSSVEASPVVALEAMSADMARYVEFFVAMTPTPTSSSEVSVAVSLSLIECRSPSRDGAEDWARCCSLRH